jgi:hypothetical protein
VAEGVGNGAWRRGVSYNAAIGGRHEVVRVADELGIGRRRGHRRSHGQPGLEGAGLRAWRRQRHSQRRRRHRRLKKVCDKHRHRSSARLNVGMCVNRLLYIALLCISQPRTPYTLSDDFFLTEIGRCSAFV